MLIVFALLNLALIPLATRLWSNGGIGAAIANLAGELAFLGVALVIIRQRVLGWSEGLYYLRVIVATVGMVLVVVRVGADLPLPALIVAGGLVYVVLSVALRTLTATDVRSVLQLVRRESRTAAGGVPAGEPLAS
jgi:hypothetical protein